MKSKIGIPRDCKRANSRDSDTIFYVYKLRQQTLIAFYIYCRIFVLEIVYLYTKLSK